MVRIPPGRHWRRGYRFGLFAALLWRTIYQDLRDLRRHPEHQGGVFALLLHQFRFGVDW